MHVCKGSTLCAVTITQPRSRSGRVKPCDGFKGGKVNSKVATKLTRAGRSARRTCRERSGQVKNRDYHETLRPQHEEAGITTTSTHEGGRRKIFFNVFNTFKYVFQEQS